MATKKVIIIEDDKMLSTVFRMFLAQMGHELIGFFMSAKEALEVIDDNKPDIVLMDIILKGDINGIVAANLIKEKYNIPVVFISSSTDDDIIGSAVDSNAYGYLVKPIDKFSMQIAIEMALNKFSYEQSLELTSNIVTSLPFLCFTTNTTGDILWANNFVKNNISQDNLTNFSTLLPNLGTLYFENTIHKSIETEQKFEDIVEINLNNTTKSYFLSCYPIELPNKPKEIAFLIKENKNRKVVSENSLNYKIEYETIKNSINEALFFFNKDSKLIETNNLANRYSDKLIESDDIFNANIYDILSFIPKHELKSLISNVLDGISHYLERRCEINEVGYSFRISLIPIEIDNKVNKYCLSLTDISSIKAIENELNNVKSDLTPIFQSSIQRFYLLDLDYKLVSFNDKAFEVIQREFRHNLKKGDSILDFVPDEIGQENFKENFEQAKMGNHISYKERLKNEHGVYVWNESHLDPVINDKGEIYRILLWTLDITESQQNIIELGKSQERYELVANGGNDGIWDWDIVSNEIYLSPRWKAVLGFEDHEIENKFGIRDSLIHPDDYQRSKQTLEDYLTGQAEIFENEIRLRHKNGEYRWILERGKVLKDTNGVPIRMAGSITDITERKQLIEDISYANKYLLEERELFNNGDVVVLRAKYDKNYSITYASENSKYVLGYSADDLISGKVKFSDFIYLDDILAHNKEREDAIKEGKKHIKYSDYRIKKENGEIIWVRDFTTIIDNKDGTQEMLGYYIDVTKYKDLEREIEENKNKYSSIFNKANDAILIVKGCEIVDYNESAKKFFKYDDNEFKNLNIESLCPETQPSGTGSVEKFNRKIKEAIDGNSEPYYWLYKRKDGSTFESEVTLSIVNMGEEQYIHTFIRDITTRKIIENSLQESQAKLHSIYEAIPDLVFIIDKDGKYLDYKPDAEKRLETNKDTIVGKNLSDFFDEVNQSEILMKIAKVIETGKIETLNYTLDSQIGVRDFESRISRINETSVLSIVRDITDD